MKKVVSGAEEAIRDIEEYMTLMLGGFCLSGIPEKLYSLPLVKKKAVKRAFTLPFSQ